METIPQGVEVSGYFQSFLYYDQLGAERFSLADLINIDLASTWFQALWAEAKDVKPVVMHLRRGDYLKEKDLFGLIGAGYYSDSLAAVRESGIDSPVWIFSNDVDAAISLNDVAKLNGRVINPPHDSDPIESLCVMALGQAHVVSNSTFAWWAARLSPSSKLVVAPRPWFRELRDPEFLVPPTWIEIEHDWSDPS